MSTKSRKKHKSASDCKSKPNNGEAEVFVLPPNLLEKLGIKLNNIVSTETFPKEQNYSTDLVDANFLSNHPGMEEYYETKKQFIKKNESSILETASLMKESVFLSPTFVPTVASVIPGEVEIARPYHHTQGCDIVSDDQFKKPDCVPVPINRKHNDGTCYNPEIIVGQVTLMKNNKTNDRIESGYSTEAIQCFAAESAKGTIDQSLPHENLNHSGSIRNDFTVKLQNLGSTEIHAKNNIGIPSNLNCGLKVINKEIIAIKNKVEVIKEETVDVAKLYKRKSLNHNLNNNVLTPISMDMILSTANKNKNAVGSPNLEQLKGSEKVVSLVHDINNVGTNVRHTEQFGDFVVTDVVKHVDVFCFENRANVLNSPNNGNILIENTGYCCGINNINKESIDNRSPLKMYASAHSDMHYHKMTEDIFQFNDINNIQNNCMVDEELENLNKKDLFSEVISHDELFSSCLTSPLLKRPVDSAMLQQKKRDGYEQETMKQITNYEINNDNICSEKVFSDKNNILSALSTCDKNEKEINSATTTFKKSKLWIQGVEKPGGHIDDYFTTTGSNIYTKSNKPILEHKNVNDHKQSMNKSSQSAQNSGCDIQNKEQMKTYKREKKETKKIIPYINHSFSKSVCGSQETNENIDASVNLDAVCKSREFCLCGDYGRLNYYDDDRSYEHIHFWEHKDVTADLDLIFSIYNSDFTYNYDNMDQTIELNNESPEESVTKICFKEIYDEINLINNNDVKCNKDDNNATVTQSSQTPFNKAVRTIECELTRDVNAFNAVDSVKKVIAVNSEKSTRDKEKSDLIYNTCLEITKTNECSKMTEGEMGNDLESHGRRDIEVSNNTPIKRVKKRKSNISVTNNESSANVEEPHCKKDVKCGVCGQILAGAEWEQHSSEAHGCIAWKDGETIDFSNNDLLIKLKKKLKNVGFLVCRFCDIEITKFKEYMTHVQDCLKNKFESNSRIPRRKRSSTIKESLQNEDLTNFANCGVCGVDVKSSDWIVHICQKHNYLAWKSGESSLDLDNADVIEQHLYEIIKGHGPIICSQCGFDRKYGLKGIKTYLEHIKICTKDEDLKEKLDPAEEADSQMEQDMPMSVESSHIDESSQSVTCGVCGIEVLESTWIDHICKTHNYLAWKQGEASLNIEDEEQVWKHLYAITKKQDGLVCSKCGIKRKYAKKYLSHIKECDGTHINESTITSSINDSQISDLNNLSQPHDVDEKTKCGVCLKKVRSVDWLDHIGKLHNYIAWKHGEPQLKITDEAAVEKHLEGIMKEHGRLFCPKCGLDHKYEVDTVKTYLLHIETCEKSEDSKEPEKQTVKCGVCNKIVKETVWIKHIGRKHNYLAWKDGETPIDLEDNESVRSLLLSLTDQVESFKCSNCGIRKIYPKSFMNHIRTCNDRSTNKSKSKDVSSNDTCECAICAEIVAVKDWDEHARSKHNNEAWKVGEVPISSENEESKTTLVKCGVCCDEVKEALWIKHIEKKHNYLAWKDGETPLALDDNESIRLYLFTLIDKVQAFKCSKCGVKKKYPKSFITHIESCNSLSSDTPKSDVCSDKGTTENLEELELSKDNNTAGKVDKTPSDSEEKVSENIDTKCGVCGEDVRGAAWLKHIETQHNYLAWKEGEAPLVLDDNEGLRLYLFTLIDKVEAFKCSKCGVKKKYPKSFIRHIESCNSLSSGTCKCDVCSEIIPIDNWEEHNLSKHNSTAGKEDITPSETEKQVPDTKCGVCGEDVKRAAWIKHIATKHNYLAWKEGETPLDLDDTENIRLHLFTLIDKVETFTCARCGLQKKYPKSFITHIQSCKSDYNISLNGTCECAICSEEVLLKNWRDHAMNKHYNLAWRVGDTPIDLKSTYGAEKYLKEYKLKKGKLVCKKCGIIRVSPIGFYAHILTCGKTEEELDEYRNLCDICNSKYLCIYKNQHLTFHREQEYAKERKLKPFEVNETEGNESTPTGRRKAAVKANVVIEKLNSTTEFKHTCPTCGFDTDCERKLARHKCNPQATFEEDSESEESEGYDDSKDFDLLEEDEIQGPSRRKKNKESMVHAKVPNVPFKFNEVNSYIAQRKEDFFNVHFTNETLFPQWLICEYELVTEDQMTKYIPRIEQSCKINVNKGWDSLNRFEAKQWQYGYSMFLGASVQCLSWVPPRIDEEDESSTYLAVSCHRDSDIPRLNYDELESHSGLIQIWDMSDFEKSVPEFVMGLAHDYGTIWAMEWCPSGAREMKIDEDKKWARLGLLAVACSDGLVYILSVPYPSTIVESGAYIKLKAVAVLKLTMGSNRKLHQATAITWSKQKGHTFVAVGYADGTTAFYDLNTSSPLLSCTENGVSVFYPYHDEREHNVSVIDLDSWPVTSSNGSPVSGAGSGGSAVSSASMGGVATLLRPEAALARLHSHTASIGCPFAPGWPTVMVAVDDAIASQAPNELEWYGCARRLGPMRKCCGCARCGRVVLHAPPMLRTMRALPPYTELRKQNIMGIRAIPLIKKREKPNDELAMQVEPLTYQEVITQFGLEIFTVDDNDKNNSINTVREQWTERFPLADVTAMEFCPAEQHHQRVAVGVHAGFVLILKV